MSIFLPHFKYPGIPRRIDFSQIPTQTTVATELRPFNNCNDEQHIYLTGILAVAHPRTKDQYVSSAHILIDCSSKILPNI